MPDEYTVEQWEHYEGEDWWNWAVWIEASDAALDRIESVEWILHPTFPNPIRASTDRPSKFRLETGGWGVFKIHARLQMKDGQQLKLYHNLSLHHPDGTPNTA